MKSVEESQSVVSSIQAQQPTEPQVTDPRVPDQVAAFGTNLGTVHKLAEQQLSSIQDGIKEEMTYAADIAPYMHRAKDIYVAGQSAVSQLQALLNQVKTGTLSTTDSSRLMTALSATLDAAQRLNLPAKTPAERAAFAAQTAKFIEDTNKFLADYDRWWEAEKVITAQQEKDRAEDDRRIDMALKMLHELPAAQQSEGTKRAIATFEAIKKKRAAHFNPAQQPRTTP